MTRVSTDIQLQALRGSAYAASPSQGGAISVGTEFHVERAFSAAEVSSFCSLSGDGNPIHTAEVCVRRALGGRTAVKCDGSTSCLVPGAPPALLRTHSRRRAVAFQTVSKPPQNAKGLLRPHTCASAGCGAGCGASSLGRPWHPLRKPLPSHHRVPPGARASPCLLVLLCSMPCLVSSRAAARSVCLIYFSPGTTDSRVRCTSNKTSASATRLSLGARSHNVCTPWSSGRLRTCPATSSQAPSELLRTAPPPATPRCAGRR